MRVRPFRLLAKPSLGEINQFRIRRAPFQHESNSVHLLAIVDMQIGSRGLACSSGGDPFGKIVKLHNVLLEKLLQGPETIDEPVI